jgi:hypothetical protein
MFKFARLKWIESDFFKRFKFVWLSCILIKFTFARLRWIEFDSWIRVDFDWFRIIADESRLTRVAHCGNLCFLKWSDLILICWKELNLIEFCRILIKLKFDWLRLVASESFLSLIDWNELSLIDEKQSCAIQVWKESIFATGDEVMSSAMIERSDGVSMRSKGLDSKRSCIGDGSNVKSWLFNASGVPRLKGVNGLLRCNSCRERRFG